MCIDITRLKSSQYTLSILFQSFGFQSILVTGKGRSPLTPKNHHPTHREKRFIMPKVSHKKRDNYIKLTVNDDELEMLNERKSQAQLAAWIRDVALGAKPINRADPMLTNPLGRIGSNLNQIAKYVNTKKEIDKEVLIGINQIRLMMMNLIDENKRGNSNDG